MFPKFCSSIVILCSFSTVQPSPLRDLVQDMNVIKMCNVSHPIERAVLNSALQYKRVELSSNSHFKCFLRCLYINFDWMTEEGTFNDQTISSELAESNLTPTMSKYLISKCTDDRSPDLCERALNFTSCFWSESSNAMNDDNVSELMLSQRFAEYGDYL